MEVDPFNFYHKRNRNAEAELEYANLLLVEAYQHTNVLKASMVLQKVVNKIKRRKLRLTSAFDKITTK